MENILEINLDVPKYTYVEQFRALTGQKLLYNNKINKEDKEELKILLDSYKKYLTEKELDDIYYIHKWNNHNISSKRTREVKRILDKLDIDKDIEWKKIFLSYESYINYDRIIVIEKDDELLGCWKTRTYAKCNVEIKI